jgi:hypothetical protein
VELGLGRSNTKLIIFQGRLGLRDRRLSVAMAAPLPGRMTEKKMNIKEFLY